MSSPNVLRSILYAPSGEDRVTELLCGIMRSPTHMAAFLRQLQACECGPEGLVAGPLNQLSIETRTTLVDHGGQPDVLVRADGMRLLWR